MTDSSADAAATTVPAPAPASTQSLPGESPAQTKSRLRRERLAAKSGASRLQQITALQGGPPKDISEFQKDVPVKPVSIPSQPAHTTPRTATPDPDEIDISQHHYQPASHPRLTSPFAFDSNASAFPPPPGQVPDASQDPMMAMLQQMMGAGLPGMPAGPGQQNGQPPNLPAGFANIFSAMQGEAVAEPSPEESSAWVWRLVHSLFSFALAIYIVLQTPFTGSKLARASLHGHDWTESPPSPDFARFFYLFATFEVVMQSSRYFIEKGQLQGTGILSTAAGILPPPYGGYARAIGRYSVIWSTAVNDAMVVVFVLGVTSWWNGAAIA